MLVPTYFFSKKKIPVTNSQGKVELLCCLFIYLFILTIGGAINSQNIKVSVKSSPLVMWIFGRTKQINLNRKNLMM